MKKTLVIIMVFVLSITLLSIAYAECLHNTIVRVDSTPVRVEYSYYSNAQHLCQPYYPHKCQDCGEEFQVPGSSYYEAHQATGYRDGGHVLGTTTHLYKSTCSKCGREYSFTVRCNGNPCVYPY